METWNTILQEMKEKRNKFVELHKNCNENDLVAFNPAYDYVIVEDGKGFNGTRVGYQSLEPIIKLEQKEILGIIKSAKYSNGKGEFKLYPTKAISYYSSCINSLKSTIEAIEKSGVDMNVTLQ